MNTLADDDSDDLRTRGDFRMLLALGTARLFDDLVALRSALPDQLGGGELYLSGLVAQTRRGRGYLRVLHRAGEIAAPPTAEEMHTELGRPGEFGSKVAWRVAVMRKQ
jgi:hypothetical protein